MPSRPDAALAAAGSPRPGLHVDVRAVDWHHVCETQGGLIPKYASMQACKQASNCSISLVSQRISTISGALSAAECAAAAAAAREPRFEFSRVQGGVFWFHGLGQPWEALLSDVDVPSMERKH